MRTVVRASASPGGVVEFLRTYFETDIGDVLPLIHVPTLVLYRPETPPRNEPAGTPTVETDARRLADAIPDGRAVSVPGPDASPFVGAALTTEIERFLASPHETVVPPRASARSERRSPGSRWRPGRESPRWARPGEVLVSRTVRDLVAGSGIEFHDRGEHELKGVLERGSSSRSAGSAR